MSSNMTPFKQRELSMSFEDSDTDMMEESSESITSPPRSANRRKARLSSNFAVATPKSRRLFDTGDDDDNSNNNEVVESPLQGYVRTATRTLKPLDSNNLDDSAESSLSSSSAPGGGRKRSSAERRDRTPSRMGMDVGGGAAADDTSTNNTMYASPRISPNSFITMDGRFVQSKNPFSSPMMTDTPTLSTQAVIQAAPSLPDTFYSSLSSSKDDDDSAKMPPSILPPRHHHHHPHLQPKGTPATQAAARLDAFSLAANGGYPDQRYGFTGSPIPEQAAVSKAAPPPQPPQQMESTDAASAGSLHKVRRINRTDDVVSATGHHLTRMSRRPPPPPVLNTTSACSSMMCDNEDGISPTDVINFPSFSPAPKKAPPPTPIKQRPSKQPYSSIRSTARTPGQPPVLTRKTGPGGGLKTPAIGGGSFDSDDDWTAATTGTNNAAAKSRFYSDFDVIGELGKGSFGTVYKVLSRLDGCMYAIKEARRQAKGAADRDRMLKEVRTTKTRESKFCVSCKMANQNQNFLFFLQVYALAALSDQADTANFHIVRYHQAWMEDDRLFIQTELCSGTLGDEVARGPLTSQRRYKLLREILLALDFIHRNNMVHLDIKPE